MESGNEGPKRYERKPNFDMAASLSRDGRYWIIKRTETWILPRRYLDVIVENHGAEKDQTAGDQVESKHRRKGKNDVDRNG